MEPAPAIIVWTKSNRTYLYMPEWPLLAQFSAVILERPTFDIRRKDRIGTVVIGEEFRICFVNAEACYRVVDISWYNCIFNAELVWGKIGFVVKENINGNG